MLSREHIQLLVQAVAVVLALNYAKGYMTGEYRNLMAVALVVVVLMAADRLLSEYEGADTKKDDTKKDDVTTTSTATTDSTTTDSTTTDTKKDDDKKDKKGFPAWAIGMLIGAAVSVVCIVWVFS